MNSITTRYLLAFTVIIFFSTANYAQDRYSIGPFIGFPVGEFKAQGTDGGGYALRGQGIKLMNRTIASNWPEFLYAGLHIKYAKFQIDNESLVRDVDESNPTFNVNIFTGNYRPVIVTTGPQFVKNLGNRLSVEILTGFGVMFTNVDPIIIELLDDQDNVISSERAVFNGNPNFTYELGLKMNFAISDYVGFSIYTDQSYTNEKITVNTSSGVPYDDSQKISFISAGCMLSFRFL